MPKEFIVAIELGSSKMTGIAGQKNLDGSITVLATVEEDSSSCIRKGPFETRGIVASAGTFGYELDLMKMSEEEKKTAREKILKYKEMEHLVQSGDYYRLVNPFENNNHVLWQFVSKDKKETVVCGVRLHSEANPYIYLFYPQGLDADLHYEDIATGKVYTGAALMKAGLPLPLTTGDYQPIRFTFKAVEK